jgi:D-glycero-alpha-D-manno-heptose-7-phosphate kinase
LAGGGTDVSPYCDIHGGYVLNATIDRYAYAVIKTLDEPRVRFAAADQERYVESALIDEALPLDGSMNLHKAVYNHIMRYYNNGRALPIGLTTFCDAPAGSGLGSSSTLVVAMIRAFVELLNLPLDDYQVAHLAFQIERIDCGLKGGRQDQYSATFGGFNFMEFYSEERTIVNPLRIKNWIICELEASLILFFTGVSRESARIIADQSQNVSSGSFEALEAMHGLKHEALAMKESLLMGDFPGLVESMRMGWENKKRSARTVSNSHIDEIYDAVLDSGALAGKVSGAGGGGFMLFFVPTEKRMDVVRTLNNFKGQVSNCHFTEHGTQAWRMV